MDWKGKMAFLLLFLLAVAIGPEPAAAADVTLYELIENMSLVRIAGEDYRQGWAALEGTASPGTPLCPLLVTCTVHATGAASVKIATGGGWFSGDLTVVVQGDNEVDGPEAVVLRAEFSGVMDFSPALLARQPYGLIDGTVTVHNRGESSPFTGIFLLPFVPPGDPSYTPHYLGLTGLMPNGAVVPVSADERVLGRPTVKFEMCLGLSCGAPAPSPMRG
jgi:hypothetical protein